MKDNFGIVITQILIGKSKTWKFGIICLYFPWWSILFDLASKSCSDDVLIGQKKRYFQASLNKLAEKIALLFCQNYKRIFVAVDKWWRHNNKWSRGEEKRFFKKAYYGYKNFMNTCMVTKAHICFFLQQSADENFHFVS